MRKFSALAVAFVIFGVGFAVGTFCGVTPQRIEATQDEPNQQFSKDVLEAYKKANKGVRELNNLFVAGGQSTPAFTGMNYFGTSVGGIDAEKDLEEGRGVDPETFAALYAGMATPKILEHLDFDQLGRLRYKKNIIRVYSQDRLKQLFQKRDQLEVRSNSAE